MNDTKVYILPGEPVSLLRARYSKVTGGVYNCQKTRQLVDRLNLQDQHNDLPPIQGPIHVHLSFYMPIPKNVSIKRRESLIGAYHIIRPDLDNCIKYYLDVAQSVLFNNDCTISEITAKKIYDTNPRTELSIKALV